MALTPEGTPYVESTDLVANYPAASLSLANRVDLVGVLPFADSAARATAIPSPTDGQYSYLQDSNSTEFWNGSAWVAAAPLSGFNLITPTSIANSGGTASASGGEVTFTGVTTVSLNGVFTSTYDIYCLIVSGSSSATGTFRLRFRAAGTDASGANYRSAYTGFGSNAATLTANTDPDETSALITTINTDLSLKIKLDLYNPQKALATRSFGYSERSSTGVYYPQFGGFLHTVATAYDGLTIYPSTGNSTGIVRVYGYKNS